MHTPIGLQVNTDKFGLLNEGISDSRCDHFGLELFVYFGKVFEILIKFYFLRAIRSLFRTLSVATIMVECGTACT